ncbi:MAG: O-antigen ligase family protein [Alphaproteobacteria bacterium]|nr:O-antigen ligase family protein [Alphaproteobacteria bacterium]
MTGFVMNEPAPYELYLVVLIAIWFLFGLKISATSAIPLTLLIIFNIGGMLSLTTMNVLESNDYLYVAVSLFLGLSTVFFAAVIEEDGERLATIFNAYILAALITAMFGILGYFGAIPSAESFTRYGRAMGVFQDPNVFGPYLVLPCCYLVYRMLTGKLATMPLRLIALLVLSVGVFLSFSRAAWGLYAFSMAMLIMLLLLQERSPLFRMRIFLLGIAGFTVIAIALLIALQFDQVSELFATRAQLVQDYDSARFGRFARYGLGFALSMEKPLGIGPVEFGKIYGEDTHNIWLKALMDYGWIGFVAFLTLVVWTLVAGFKCLLRDRPWRPYFICIYTVFLGHILIGMVIDIDHWRHFYILLGVIWGCIGLEQRYQRRRFYAA